jgi:hypothetical protein
MVERTTVFETPALHVEMLRCALGRAPTAETYTTRRQVMFPLAGTFRWHVGRCVMLCDPNQVMFVETNEASFDTPTRPGTVTCLLATVADPAARRLWRTAAAFRKRAVRLEHLERLGRQRDPRADARIVAGRARHEDELRAIDEHRIPPPRDLPSGTSTEAAHRWVPNSRSSTGKVAAKFAGARSSRW